MGRTVMKRLYLTFAVALLMAGLAKPALAQEWPQQNIRIVVSFGPGGGADIIAASWRNRCKPSSASR